MSDYQMVAAEIRAAVAAGREISDACARMIAASYHSDGVGAAFSTSGAVTGDVYRSLFYLRGEHMYDSASPHARREMDMMGTYLTALKDDPRATWSEDDGCWLRPAVPGWSGLWLR